ncbi:MAG: 30S ribosomal protein S20, partial [Planctomycetota bacterium]
VVQKLDKTAATSTLHKRTVARKKSQLAKRLNALKAKKS